MGLRRAKELVGMGPYVASQTNCPTHKKMGRLQLHAPAPTLTRFMEHALVGVVPQRDSK